MNNAHDDLPHPVPPMAYLRWKENYFFIIIDPSSDVFGVFHFVCEPIFNRVRISGNLNIKGRNFRYLQEFPFPDNFAFSPTLGNGEITLFVDKSHHKFRLRIETEELKGELEFSPRMPSFDFAACKYAAPDLPSFKDVMTLGLNLPFEHLQQAMFVKGRLQWSGDGEPVRVDGWGYRDHSWCVRTDNLVSSHTWCGLNFPSFALGVMTISTLVRPEVVAKEGYVATAEETNALTAIDVEVVRSGAGRVDKVVHRVADVSGRTFTIESDVAGRLSEVPLNSEKPVGDLFYDVSENFCRSVLLETGEEGLALIELGRSVNLSEART